jgi:Uma2 family endonuclease
MSDLARDRPMTFEDAAQLDPADHGGELEDGRFVRVTRNTWRHGEIVGNVYAVLRAYARSHPGWSVSVGDPGAKLHRDPDTLRGPDVGVIRAERRPAGAGQDGWLDGAPDVAVEVLGDAQRFSELVEKALEYLDAGGKMVLLLDPEPRRAVVCTPPNAVLVLGSDDVLEGGDVLPGFRCSVSELFD